MFLFSHAFPHVVCSSGSLKPHELNQVVDVSAFRLPVPYGHHRLRRCQRLFGWVLGGRGHSSARDQQLKASFAENALTRERERERERNGLTVKPVLSNHAWAKKSGLWSLNRG